MRSNDSYLPLTKDGMVQALRKAFNQAFSKQTYEDFQEDLNHPHPSAIEFRIAEAPVFVQKILAKKIIETCEFIVDQITDPGFMAMTNRSIPPSDYVPNENDRRISLPSILGFASMKTESLSPN
jgi:hypothetical protein